MSKDKISDYSATANSNTDIAGINIDEGCAPSGINNAIRTLMKQLKDFQQGTNSDPFNGPVNGTIGATTPAAGVFTTLSSTGNTTLGDASTDTVTVNGYIGVGVAPASNKALQVSPTALTSNDQVGIGSFITGSSAGINSVRGLNVQIGTAAAAYTLTSGYGAYFYDAVKGAGSTITNQHGVYITDQTQGTNNYGITSAVSSGTNKWNIYASGTAANYFAGNVGIGTTSPGVPLDVVGTVRSSANASGNSAFQATASTGTASLIAQSNSRYWRWLTSNGDTTFKLNDETAGATRLTVDTSGNLGLGVTPSAWSTDGNLEIKGSRSIVWADPYANFLSNAYNDGAWKYKTTGASAFYTQNAGQHRWYNAPSGTAGNAITFTQAMTLDASGNLGIGTTSPLSRAHIAYAGDTNFRAQNTSASVTTLLGSDSTGGYVGTFTNHPVVVYSNSSERMRIDSSGNVLVTGAGGLGYGTGSGGAVTQATSRTTGVTLNKTNGAITLVSAAGSTSWQSFTVTNSTVAATDTVIVNQKSGTDLYEIHVTAVAAGSFRISFKTTAGTTTEQPVFNFAVIKAVTA